MSDLFKASNDSDTLCQIVRPGSETKVARGASVTVHATGQVLGSPRPFWSTKDPGQSPFTYTAGVGQVIKGWDVGCLGMGVGELRKLTIPPHEGYGKNGFPAWGIIPNATLVFNIEVLDVK